MVQNGLNVLIVDDDESIRDMLSIVLKDENYNVLTAEDGKKALIHLKKNKINLVISDIKMPDMDGIELLNIIKKKDEKIPVIMITGHASTNDAIEAMKIGAEQYITKPFNIDELKVVIEKAIYRKKIEEENIELKSKIGSWTEYEKIIGKSKHMLEIFVLIESMSENDSTVLISGESGTGKEVVARYVHQLSERTG
ncbi:MAG: sigma-54-dependent Fis family transcriptional regulator, partial [Candidatus Aminicenantes bacterium]|nr:sigma-54-dependent Fis family transcriptional regulator [Candidatus Aminicenantes bacterium]